MNTCTPQELVTKMACLSCMNKRQSKSVGLSLICQWSNKSQQYPASVIGEEAGGMLGGEGGDIIGTE